MRKKYAILSIFLLLLGAGKAFGQTDGDKKETDTEEAMSNFILNHAVTM